MEPTLQAALQILLGGLNESIAISKSSEFEDARRHVVETQAFLKPKERKKLKEKSRK